MLEKSTKRFLSGLQTEVSEFEMKLASRVTLIEQAHSQLHIQSNEEKYIEEQN